MTTGLYAGAARVDISPPPGIPHAGWGAQTHQRAAGVDMPLVATALVLRQAETSVAIVEVDLIGLDEAQSDAIRREIASLSGIPESAVRLSTSHTHSGPNYYRTALVTEGLDLLESYMAALPKRIAAAVWEAARKLEPVEAGFGTGVCPIVVNRRASVPPGRIVVGHNERGAADPTVRVLRFAGIYGNTVATILHYACHPTIMAWENEYVTPDYPGPARRQVEEVVGGLCLFLQGAAGNVHPIQGFTGDLSVYRRLGRVLGLEAASVALRIEIPLTERRFLGVQESGAPIAIYEYDTRWTDNRLALLSRRVALPIKPLPPVEILRQREYELREELLSARESGEIERTRVATAMATQAGILTRLAQSCAGRSAYELELQAIRIGRCALVGIPCEPFVEIGMEISAKSPFPMTLFSGYTNGTSGYLPVPAAYDEGGYEVNGTPFARSGGEIVVREVLAALEELHAASEPDLISDDRTA